MLELEHVYTTARATSIKHYSIEEAARSFWFSLAGAEPLRYISWAVEKMQLNSNRPEASNEDHKKDTDGKQTRISIATHK